MTSPEIVGRDDELAILRESLAAPHARRVVLVEGEPGIGKTTLLDAAARLAAASGRRILTARPAPAEAALSYSAVHDLLEPVLPEVLSALPDPQRRALEVALLLAEPEGRPPDRRAVSLSVLGALRALGESSPLLVVDDVQWLDAASAAALQFTLRRLPADGVAMLAAARSGEPLPLDLTRELAPARVELPPLSLGALHRLLVSRLGLALPRPTLLRIEKASRGNPFYALELARLVAARGAEVDAARPLPIPADLADVTWERLSSLPRRLRDDLALVAALAAPTIPIVEAASPGAERGILRAIEAGVLARDGVRLRFTHPLLAETLLERIGPQKLRAVHTRLAGVVDAPEERARHLALSAQGPDATIADAVDAAAQAVAHRSPEAAAELHELAARLSTAPEAAAARTIAAADELIAAGDATRARAALERVVEQLPRGPLRARALFLLANAREDDLDAAIALAERACAEAERDEATVADAHCYLAWTRSLAGDLEGGFEHARRAEEVAETLGNDARLVDALTVLGMLEVTTGRPTTTALDRAVELEGALGERKRPPHYRNPHYALGRRLLYEDRLDDGREELRTGYRMSVARGDFFERPQILFYLAELELLAGRWGAAAAAIEEAYETAQQLALAETELSVLTGVARVDAYRGAVESARSRAEHALAAAEEAGDETFSIRALTVLGFLELSLGRAERAAAHFREAAERGATRAATYYRQHPDAIEAELLVGDVDAAEALLAVLEAQSTPWTVAAAARCRALLAAARGDIARATSDAEHAVALHERLGMPFELARTLLVRGAILRRVRRKADARASIEGALELFDGLGAPLWAEKARDELARIGGRARAGGLTPSEQRTAELVAEGRSNKEVAAALFVTVRTVERNLTRIYEKLGVRSRAELARRFAAGEGRSAAP